MHEFVQVYSSSLLQIFTFYCYLSRAHRRRAAFLLSRVLAFRSSLSLSLLSFSRPLFSILVIYLLIYFSTRSNTTKGWPFLSFSPFEAPSPPLCLFIKFVLLLLSDAYFCYSSFCCFACCSSNAFISAIFFFISLYSWLCRGQRKHVDLVSVVEKTTTTTTTSKTTTKTNPKSIGHHHIIFRLDGCHIFAQQKNNRKKKKRKKSRARIHTHTFP